MGEIPFPGWDPVFLEIPGVPVDLRYYGLMYIVGFVCGHFILVRLARQGFLPLPVERVGDLLFALILGVVIGGRLGYSLFYKPQIFQQPLEVFKVWEGGLSFHGGLIGVIIAFIWFSRRNGLASLPMFRVGDSLTLAACPGIFFVRVANFINAELCGRIIPKSEAADVPWAMRFPTISDEVVRVGVGITGGMSKREQERAVLKAYEDGSWQKLLDEGLQTPVGVRHVPFRHPSQLYEALAEGLILGIIMLLALRLTRRKPLGTGSYMGIFLIGYGAMRFFIEYYREPDNIAGLIVLGLTRGQQLCLVMIILGVTVMILRRKKHWVGPVGDDGAEAVAA